MEVAKAKERSSKAVQWIFAGIAILCLIVGGYLEFLSTEMDYNSGNLVGYTDYIGQRNNNQLGWYTSI